MTVSFICLYLNSAGEHEFNPREVISINVVELRSVWSLQWNGYYLYTMLNGQVYK